MDARVCLPWWTIGRDPERLSSKYVHQDPISKSQRITNSSGTIVSTVDLDPWGAERSRSSNQAFRPLRYASYTRDTDGGDDAMHHRNGAYVMVPIGRAFPNPLLTTAATTSLIRRALIVMLTCKMIR